MGRRLCFRVGRRSLPATSHLMRGWGPDVDGGHEQVFPTGGRRFLITMAVGQHPDLGCGLDDSVRVLTAGEMHRRQVLVAGGDRTIRLWSVTGNRQVAEIQIGMTPQDVQLTPDGYLCIATVMGIAALHVPDWTAPARLTVG
jgi:hypothetical protein